MSWAEDMNSDLGIDEYSLKDLKNKTMENKNNFINGLMAKKGHEKTPWIKAKLSIKREELIATLQGMTEEWVNCDVCESKKDPLKWYVKIDDWKPKIGEVVEAGKTDDLDF